MKYRETEIPAVRTYGGDIEKCVHFRGKRNNSIAFHSSGEQDEMGKGIFAFIWTRYRENALGGEHSGGMGGKTYDGS